MDRAHVGTIYGLVDREEDCCSCSEPALFEIETHGEFGTEITLPACLSHTKGFIEKMANAGVLYNPE